MKNCEIKNVKCADIDTSLNGVDVAQDKWKIY